jgi:two-component system OmpR family response regulator
MSRDDMSQSQPDETADDGGPVRVLLIDDEASLREPLADYLETQGFAVTQATSAARARSILAEADADPSGSARPETVLPDIVLLDIMMPGEDGLSLCRHLVETRALPVIFLTARTEATDRIVGLELGADDYVLKPFEPRELVARIRTVLRRVARGASPAAEAEDWHYAFEDWVLDPLKRKLTDPEGVTVPISTAEFRLLRAFLDNPKRVLDRDLLLDMVQGRTAHLFDRAVDNQVSRLRRKIESDTRNPHFIQTVRGGGYRFGAQVRRIAPQV